ncbi:GNAT family N-acetyltransferase [Paenibacillus abyssi]|nr:GNAT family protein [Paenibacillus abyssi]
MSALHAQTICTWNYPPPYDLFNWPSWEQMSLNQTDFGDPELRERQFASIIDTTGDLIGFAQFFPLLGVTRLGLGLRPSLCGTGLGVPFVRVIAEEAQRRAPFDEIDLEVLTWNTRAIHTYEKAGFQITDTYQRNSLHGPAEFHCMVLKAPVIPS